MQNSVPATVDARPEVQNSVPATVDTGLEVQSSVLARAGVASGVQKAVQLMLGLPQRCRSLGLQSPAMLVGSTMVLCAISLERAANNSVGWRRLTAQALREHPSACLAQRKTLRWQGR